MNLRFKQQVLDLLNGAIDIHIHSAPDVYPRILNDIELAEQARDMGMRAILVKNHFFETASRAQLATDAAGFPVFGGIALNQTVGGLNAQAVETALKLGAKTVWMPTLHSREFVANKSHVANLAGELGDNLQGLYVLKDDGSVKDELHPIFDLIKKHNSSLATGHLSIKEAKAVVKAAAEAGVPRIIVTHPLASFVNYSTEDMKEILDLGATFLEHVFNDTTRQVGHPITRETLFNGMKAIGAKHCIMSTDAGQWLNPVPVQQMGIYIQDALNFGFSEDEVRAMVQENPAAMLGLED